VGNEGIRQQQAECQRDEARLEEDEPGSAGRQVDV
jgi:hypothetical protein